MLRETNCREPSERERRVYCPVAQVAGKSVSKVTVQALVRPEVLSKIFGEYYFCDLPDCDVVYFNADEMLIRKSDVRVPVHQKDSNADTPVCYCFGHTPGKIFEEIERTGQSSAVAEITQKVKEGVCFCGRSNPQGTCCLGNVGNVVKRGLGRFRNRQREVF